jgi:hypothetical protein
MLTPHDLFALDTIDALVKRLGELEPKYTSAPAFVRGRLLKLVHSSALDPERQGTQISIKCCGSFAPTNLEQPVIVSGARKSLQGFKPELLSATASVTCHYENASYGPTKSFFTDDNATDAALVQAFIGDVNCYPHAPEIAAGIALPSFQRMPLDWPTIQTGNEINLACALKPSILSRAVPPAGNSIYDLIRLDVEISIDLFGSLPRYDRVGNPRT